MSVRFQADNDLNRAIVMGVRRREPAVDFRLAQEAGFDNLSDLEVLASAAAEGRILVTHDRKTMPRHFRAFIASGRTSPGVVVVSQKAAVAQVIDGLVLLWAASDPSEWQDRIFDLL